MNAPEKVYSILAMQMSQFFLVVIIALALQSCGSGPDIAIETFKVERGEFVVSVTETGELEAVNSQTISAPTIPWNLGGLKITKLVEDGQQVEKDEILAEFDKTEVQKNLEDAKSALEIALAEVRKAQAIQDSEIEELSSNLKKLELQDRISALELEKAGYEADIKKKEKELDLEKAQIALEKVRLEIENKKKVHHQELSKLELKVKQERTKVVEAEETLARLTVRAPTPGIAILRKNWNTGNKIQVNEEFWRGQALIGLPDVSKMQAVLQVNEVDISKIDTTQEALIRMDAFPDTSFAAKVHEIAVLARNKERNSKVKVFDVTVLLAEKDSTLLPGLTVSCEIIIDRVPEALFVPLDAVFQREGETVVYLKKGGGFDARVVVTGAENDDYAIIAEGLEEGDEVALVDPTETLLALGGSSKK